MNALRTFGLRTLLAVGLVATFAACDVPTAGPDFSFTTNVRAPLLFDQTYVFMGPDAQGRNALIDTTDAAFDSLFTVDAASRTLHIVRDLEDFNIGDFGDDLFPKINVDPVTVDMAVGDLGEQTFSAAFETRLGAFSLDASALPALLFQELPLLPDPTVGAATIPVPNFLVPPQVDLVSLSGVELAAVRFTDDDDGANAFVMELINDLPLPLTAATNPAAEPTITLLQNGTVLGTGSFGFVDPGSRASVRISLAGQRVSREDFSYQFDVGTAQGVLPLLAAPGSVRIKTALEPLHYAESEVTSIPAQAGIDLSVDEMSLGADTDGFGGLVAKNGTMTLHIVNTLPIPARIEVLEMVNREAVGDMPAGHVFFRTEGQSIPANGAVDLPLDLGTASIAPHVSVTATASSDGTTTPVTLAAEQGLFFSLDGNVAIDRLFFTPGEETFEAEGVFDVAIDDVRFTSDDHYVTLKGGMLEIDNLINGLDVAFDRVEINMPGLRVPPYRPEDALVVTFAGSVNKPDEFTFSKLKRNSAARRAEVDLTDVRVYPIDGELSYHVTAESEAASGTREVTTDDRISATLQVRDAQISGVSALIDPFSVEITEDDNGDGRLDVLNDREAAITTLDGLSDLTDVDFDGLSLVGSELTFSIRTNMTADVTLYAVLLGTTAEGEQIFLNGRGDYAVSASDTLAASFVAGGASLQAGNLIRFTLKGAPSPGQPVTRTIVLNADNSNVDAFISGLPEEIRYVGKALIEGPGGRVQLAEPFELSASLGASIPLAIGDAFTFREVVDADLSALTDLTDPAKDFTLEGADLRLAYTNGLPLGVDARIEVLDAFGEVTVTFPAEGNPALRLAPAPTGDAGTATEAQTGMLEFPIDEAELRSLAGGTQMRLVLTFLTADGTDAARLRTDDAIQMSLQGDFRFDVQVK